MELCGALSSPLPTRQAACSAQSSPWAPLATWFCTGAFQVALGVKILPANAIDNERCRFDPWLGKIPWRRKMATHSSTLAWKNPMDNPGIEPTSLVIYCIGRQDLYP